MFSRSMFSRSMFSRNECFQHFFFLEWWVIFKYGFFLINNTYRGHFFNPVCERGIVQHREQSFLSRLLKTSKAIESFQFNYV